MGSPAVTAWIHRERHGRTGDIVHASSFRRSHGIRPSAGVALRRRRVDSERRRGVTELTGLRRRGVRRVARRHAVLGHSFFAERRKLGRSGSRRRRGGNVRNVGNHGRRRSFAVGADSRGSRLDAAAVHVRVGVGVSGDGSGDSDGGGLLVCRISFALAHVTVRRGSLDLNQNR